MNDMLKESPSQTAGPYVHLGCVPTFAGVVGIFENQDLGSQMITGNPDGEKITLTLRVTDGDGDAVTDGIIEIWQPGPDGSFGPTAGFFHWGRQAMHPETGLAQFDTLKPGTANTQSPHFLVWIVARGINLGLTTRVYLPDVDNRQDPVFALSGNRCGTLVAQATGIGYHHDIYLQGERETVFFNV